MIYFFVIVVLLIVAHIAHEVELCRKGRDVYDWTHKLSTWLKTKGY